MKNPQLHFGEVNIAKIHIEARSPIVNNEPKTSLSDPEGHLTVDDAPLKANIQAEKIRISIKTTVAPEPECDAVHKTETHFTMKGVLIKKLTFLAYAMQ